MNPNGWGATLRELRPRLVAAAERIASDLKDNIPDKSQLSKLCAVCAEATCSAEITNYLYYQTARQRPSWKSAAVDALVKGIEPVLHSLKSDDEQVLAWRYYALYFLRAARYQLSTRESRSRR